jgi:hypothetical protein
VSDFSRTVDRSDFRLRARREVSALRRDSPKRSEGGKPDTTTACSGKQDAIDDVDDTVRLHDVRDRDVRHAALGIFDNDERSRTAATAAARPTTSAGPSTQQSSGVNWRTKSGYGREAWVDA